MENEEEDLNQVTIACFMNPEKYKKYKDKIKSHVETPKKCQLLPSPGFTCELCDSTRRPYLSKVYTMIHQIMTHQEKVPDELNTLYLKWVDECIHHVRFGQTTSFSPKETICEYTVNSCGDLGNEEEDADDTCAEEEESITIRKNIRYFRGIRLI